MKELVVKREESGKRVDRFLLDRIKRLSASSLSKLFRKSGVRLCGVHSTARARVKEGDVLSVYLPDAFFEEDAKTDFLFVRGEVKVAFEDENVLIAEKPAGLLCLDETASVCDTMQARIQKKLFDEGAFSLEDAFYPQVVHRLDRNTEGLVIAAKNERAHEELLSAFREHRIHKKYLAVVKGIPKEKEQTLFAFLEKDAKRATVRIFAKAGRGKPIETRYRVLSERKTCALCEIEIPTGRTHQIRAHMAFIGHPLVGDGKYGTAGTREKQALLAAALSFSFPNGSLLAALDGLTVTAEDKISSAFASGTFD